MVICGQHQIQNANGKPFIGNPFEQHMNVSVAWANIKETKPLSDRKTDHSCEDELYVKRPETSKACYIFITEQDDWVPAVDRQTICRCSTVTLGGETPPDEGDANT